MQRFSIKTKKIFGWLKNSAGRPIHWQLPASKGIVIKNARNAFMSIARQNLAALDLGHACFAVYFNTVACKKGIEIVTMNGKLLYFVRYRSYCKR